MAADRRRHLETVLLVGRPDADQTLEAALLKRHGFAVLTAASPDEAVRECRDRRPDLVVAPAGLKRGDGMLLTTALRAGAETRDVGVLCVARSVEEAEGEMRRGAADTVLLRPVRTRMLVQELALIIDRRQARARRPSVRSRPEKRGDGADPASPASSS